MSAYIEGHKGQFGVEPICDVLQFAPQTYYAAVTRQPSMRDVHDGYLREAIEVVWVQNHGVYGADKVWAQLGRDGVPAARCTVERLMRKCGWRGVVRGRRVRTTVAADQASRPGDLVHRKFHAAAPNLLWVADLTYVRTHSGWVYVAFIIDVYSRRIVGWQASRSLRTDLALDALEMAIGQRRPDAVIHHSDQGSQYTSLGFGKRCREAGVRPSMGSVGDAYDNAMCESFFATLECELLDRRRFASQAEAKMACFSFIEGWYNPVRLHSALGYRSPMAYEAAMEVIATEA